MGCRLQRFQTVYQRYHLSNSAFTQKWRSTNMHQMMRYFSSTETKTEESVNNLVDKTSLSSSKSNSLNSTSTGLSQCTESSTLDVNNGEKVMMTGKEQLQTDLGLNVWERASPLRKPEPPSLPIATTDQYVFWKVKPSDDGARLDRFIKRKAPSLPAGFIQKLIRQRKIRVNETTANRNAYELFPDDIVKVPGNLKLGHTRGKRKPPSDDVSLSESEIIRSWILHLDARSCVLNKPIGLPTQPAGPSVINPRLLSKEARKSPERRIKLGDGDGPLGTDERRCLQDLLYGLGNGHYWLVHRLDTNVSGCIVVARDVGAAGLLSEYFKNQVIEKTYWALVEGKFKEKQGQIQIPVDGKRAYTSYRMIHRVDNRYAWVELKPKTGRKHQLRIHCAEGLGCPIVGDVRYGAIPSDNDDMINSAITTSMGLHLMSRSIKYPILTENSVGSLRRNQYGDNDSRKTRTKWVVVDAPLPPHMKDTWKRLGLDEKWASLNNANA